MFCANYISYAISNKLHKIQLANFIDDVNVQ